MKRVRIAVRSVEAAILSAHAVDKEPRCRACNRMLARELTRPWTMDCPRCRRHNSSKNGSRKNNLLTR